MRRIPYESLVIFISVLCALISAVALVVLLVGPGANWWESRDRETRLASAMLGFERAIGYGGLIHNFKNHVLRPDEPEYLAAIQRDLEQTQSRLDEIEALFAATDLSVDLEPVRKTFAEYIDRLQALDTLIAEGANARALDEVARVDDTQAVATLDATLAAALARFEQERANALMLVKIVTGAAALFALLSLTTAFLGTAAHRQRRAEALRASREEVEQLEDMTRIATHDIRAPLRQIAFLVDDVLQQSRDAGGQLDPESLSDLDLISSRVERIDRLVGETLGMLRSSSRLREFQNIDVQAIAQDIVATDAPPDCQLSFEGRRKISSDPAILQILLRNLISNAIKHNDKGMPQLLIRVEVHQRTARISVEDNGPGIPAEYHERIFDLFQTLKVQEPDASVGGVGLAMVRKLVLSLGGQIQVTGSRLGGVGFEFTVPQG